MGTLIILEGGDGSGKATQTKLLVERLTKEGHAVKSVSFPNYDSGAAMPIKMVVSSLQIVIQHLIWCTKWLNTMIQRNVLHF